MEAIAPDHRLAGRYVLERPIAAGGMATVWLARDEVLARPVAVKVLRADLSGDSTFAQRFQTEAGAAARLTHPNIVSVFDTGVEDGVHYIVMEHFPGRTLLEVMRGEPRMEPDQVIDVIVPVLVALGFAHAEGVLHRDVKPANILVGEDGRVKVTDFGIAKAAFAAHDLTRTGSVLGTVRYVSPEQVQGGPLDARSDLYAVGVILYEALTGRAPFLAETDVAVAMLRLTADPIPPRDIRPSIPRPLEALVLRAMARPPDERFHSADAMRAALERLRPARDRTPPQGVPRVHRVAPRRPSRRFRPLTVAVVLLSVGVAAALAFALVSLEPGRRPGSRAASGAQSSTQASGQLIPIRSARDYDPEGDGSEHPDQVQLAIDGNPGTAWTTDHYNTAAFGNLKRGVGLWLDLGGSRDVGSVTIASSVQNWSFQLLPGPYGKPGAPMPATDGATSFTLRNGEATIRLRPARTPGVLIWITTLAPDQGRFAAAVGEVTVRSG